MQHLFDTHDQLAGQTILSQLGGPAQVLILRPRTIGMRRSTRFGSGPLLAHGRVAARP